MHPTIPTADTVGTMIESAVRSVAKLCAVIYTLGYMLGEAVHKLNDTLAGVTPVPNVRLKTLTVSQLRELADLMGVRLPSRCRKAAMISMLAGA